VKFKKHKRCLYVILMNRSATFLVSLIAWLILLAHPAFAQQSSPSPAASPNLQCQGCHAPGKTLPYLGGAKFHTQAHEAYDHGFHARAIQDGRRAATCNDCHASNGDMTTVLPATDPNSTINRNNIAETCGRCHGDKSVMQGSGISDRPFLSYRESVHAKALAQGNTGLPFVPTAIIVMTFFLPLILDHLLPRSISRPRAASATRVRVRSLLRAFTDKLWRVACRVHQFALTVTESTA
jgi:cytochrome c553